MLQHPSLPLGKVVVHVFSVVLPPPSLLLRAVPIAVFLFFFLILQSPVHVGIPTRVVYFLHSSVTCYGHGGLRLDRHFDGHFDRLVKEGGHLASVEMSL